MCIPVNNKIIGLKNDLRSVKNIFQLKFYAYLLMMNHDILKKKQR